MIFIVFKGGDAGQIPAAFTPSQAISGWGGLGKAFVFIVLAFFGFESCLTVAEETENPRRNLPIALVGSVTLAGLWFSFAMYAIVIGYGSEHMDLLANSSEPLQDLAVRYIGHMYGNLVDMAAFSAIIAVVLAIHTANFRVFYSLGRDGCCLTRSAARIRSIRRRTSRLSGTPSAPWRWDWSRPSLGADLRLRISRLSVLNRDAAGLDPHQRRVAVVHP